MYLAVGIFNVHVVVACAAEGNELDPHLTEAVYHEPVYLIVNKYADGIAPFCQLICISRKPRLQISDVELIVAVRGNKGIPVVILGIVKGNLYPVHSNNLTFRFMVNILSLKHSMSYSHQECQTLRIIHRYSAVICTAGLQIQIFV